MSGSSPEPASAAEDTIYGLQRAPAPAAPVALPAGSGLATTLLRWLGWQNHFAPLPSTHGLVIVYPHTSNWDFPIGLLYKWSRGLPFRFWIKDSAMRLPVLGKLIARWGGVAINRKAAHGVIETTVQEMRNSDFFWLVAAPEGTRSYTNGWRTGFYHLWKATGCPLGLAYIDYGKKEVGMHDYVLCSGDMEADFAALAKYYADRTGYHPELASPVQPYQKPAKSPTSP